MIKKIAKRLMGKAKSRKGFTLAELLVVVAIIGVLMAIAMPIFFSAKSDAEAAVKRANCRSVLAEATADYLTDETLDKTSYTYDGETYTASKESQDVIKVVGAGYTCNTNAPEPVATSGS